MAKRGPDPKYRKKGCKPTQHCPADNSDWRDREYRNRRKEAGCSPNIIAEKSRRWIGVAGHATSSISRSEDFACIEPEHRGMGEAYRDQPVKERVRCLILDQMVGQDSCRLIGAHGAEAARPQVFHQTTQRRSFPDKPTTSFQSTRSTWIFTSMMPGARGEALRARAREIPVRPQ